MNSVTISPLICLFLILSIGISHGSPEKMPDVFFKMFKASPKTVIKFLSNKSNFFEDLSIILKMPKLTFIKALFY